MREQREREAQVQRECEKEQCKECECLKRQQVMDEQLSKKVVEELKKQVETLKSQLVESEKQVETLKTQLVESEKEVDTVMCELFESKNEHVAWKKQFWILNDKYEALQQKNMEMHQEERKKRGLDREPTPLRTLQLTRTHSLKFPRTFHGT
jgi:chromosome segregation ATPase